MGTVLTTDGRGALVPEFVRLELPFEPVAWARTRGKGANRHTQRKQRQYKNACLRFLEAQHNPRFGGPMAVRVSYRFYPPKSWSKTKTERALRGDQPHVSKPDLDNLDKMLFDVLTDAGWWTDDCLLIRAHSDKAYGSRPGTFVWFFPASDGRGD